MVRDRRHALIPVLPTLLLSIILVSCAGGSRSSGHGLYGGSWIPEDRPAEFDLQHLLLDVTVDHTAESVTGSVAHRLVVHDPATDSLTFDAGPAVRIDSVTAGGRRLGYRREERLLRVERPEGNAEVMVKIWFATTDPGRGIFFTHLDDGELEGVDGFWTQGEPTDHHRWFPLADRPSDLATTETIVRTRSDWSVISNGTLLGSSPVPGTDLRQWHYRMERPHAPYLLVIAGADYLVTRDSVLGIDLEYWTWKEMPERVETTFHRTPDMMKWFDSLLAYPYPWEIYRQVVVDEFIYGGMESTTATVLDDNLLVDEAGRLDIDPDGTIAHEIAHQWFGDLVTVRDWKDLWIHESFATYLAARYLGSRFGSEEFSGLMAGYIGTAAWSDREYGPDPIVGGETRTVNIYGRGAVVLHMLNRLIGDKAFTEGMRTFLREHAGTVVETADVIDAFEQASGMQLYRFFDQWIFGKDMPIVRVTKEQRGDSVRYRIAQDPRYGSRPEVFVIPTEIQIYYQAEPGNSRMTMQSEKIEIGEKWVYTKWYPHRPTNEFMVLAPDASALMRIEYEANVEELWDQMHVSPSSVDRADAAGRLAVQLIPHLRNAPPSVVASMSTGLTIRYDEEPDPTVRSAILLIAGVTGTAVGRELIRKGTNDPDPEVRAASLQLFRSWDPTQLRDVYGHLLSDPSADVVADAIRIFRRADVSLTDEELRRLSQVFGTRDEVARQWVQTVAEQNAVEYVDRVAAYALGGNTWLRVAALGALADLKVMTPPVRNAILVGSVSANDNIVHAAWEAAEALGDAELDQQIDRQLAELSQEEQKRIENARKG